MQKNKDYWRKRFDQIEQAANNKSVKYTKQLEKKYGIAEKEIDAKVNAWYQRLADNNGVSITEAKKLLTASELKEFQWTVEEYIKYGQENAIDQRWMKELENASAKFHINRLEALKLEARQQVEQLFAGGQEAMFDTLADVYKDTFYHSCFEIQKGFGVGFDVSKLDDKQVSKVLMQPWAVDGTNFSEKLWGNKRKLINTLDQELSRMVLTGETPQRAIANIRKAMDVSQKTARRLVLTEQAYFTSVAQQDAYGELDVEEYEFVSIFDFKTCDECGDLNGQHFPVTEMHVGVNAPPMHPYCRCTTCPYFNDEFTVNDKRTAKNEETGEWYEVPSDMSYREWKSAFVDGVWSNDLKEIEKSTRSTEEHNFDLTFDRKSKEYRQKYIDLDESEAVTHSMINDTSAILKHRGGTNYEDLAYINSVTNEHKIQSKYNVEGEVLPSEEMKKLLAESEPYTIIAIHNHPKSSSPSISDLNGAYKRRYKYGLIACHDGKIFKYSVEKPIDKSMEDIIAIRLSRLDNALKSDLFESQKEVDNILNQLYDDGIKLEVM